MLHEEGLQKARGLLADPTIQKILRQGPPNRKPTVYEKTCEGKPRRELSEKDVAEIVCACDAVLTSYT